MDLGIYALLITNPQSTIPNPKSNMTQRGRIETACEIARVFVCGENWRNSAGWCDGCKSEVPMITELNAAILEKTTCAAIFRRVEIGELHHQVTADGALRICLSSLLDVGDNLNC